MSGRINIGQSMNFIYNEKENELKDLEKLTELTFKKISSAKFYYQNYDTYSQFTL